MPYGPDRHTPDRVYAGTLELLSQREIVQSSNQSDCVGDNVIDSKVTWQESDATELEDAVDAARNARIVIMNPPFTSRSKMGEKFPANIQTALRGRADLMERELTKADPDLTGFWDRNSIEPLFVYHHTILDTVVLFVFNS